MDRELRDCPTCLAIENPRLEDEPGGMLANVYGTIFVQLRRHYFYRSPRDPRVIRSRIIPKSPRKKGGVRLTAEDVFQDAFAFAWVEHLRLSPEEQEKERARPWDVYQRLRTKVNAYIVYQERLAPTPSYDIAPHDPEIEVGITEPSAVLLRALRSLPSSLRETAEMRFLDGLQYREIAQLRGVSTGTVSRYIYEAKTILRKNRALRRLAYAVITQTERRSVTSRSSHFT